jgi:hypothetical protein
MASGYGLTINPNGQQIYLTTPVPTSIPNRYTSKSANINSLVMNPANAASAGKSSTNLPREAWIYKTIHAVLKMNVTASGATGATVTSQSEQKNIFSNVSVYQGSGEAFYSLRGANIDALNRFFRNVRASNPIPGETYLTSAAAGTYPVTYEFDIDFQDPTVFPKLYSALNIDKNAGIDYASLDMTFDTFARLISGDTSGTYTIESLNLGFDVLDPSTPSFSAVPGKGVDIITAAYTQTTQFPRFQPNVMGSQQLLGTSNQEISLPIGLAYRGILVQEWDPTNTIPELNDITEFSLVRNRSDRKYDGVDSYLVNFDNAQRYETDLFTNYAQNLYFLDACPNRDIQQAVNTAVGGLQFAEWYLLVTNTSTAKPLCDIIPLVYQVPNLPSKHPAQNNGSAGVAKPLSVKKG